MPAIAFLAMLCLSTLSPCRGTNDNSRSLSLFDVNSTDDDVLAIDDTTNDDDNVTASNESSRPNSNDDESFLPSDDEWFLPQSSLTFHVFASGSYDDWGSLGYLGSSTAPATDDNNDDDGVINNGWPLLLDISEDIASVSAGSVHSVLLTFDGVILSAGGADDEASGLGRNIENSTDSGRFLPVTEVYMPYSTLSDGASTSSNPTSTATLSMSTPPKFTKIVASQYYTVAIDEEGRVWTTGNNYYGQLCLNDTLNRDRFAVIPTEFYNAPPETDGNSTPKNVNFTRIVDVALGQQHSLLLREDGVVFGCGWNEYGQLGLGKDTGNVSALAMPSNDTRVLLPTKVQMEENVIGIAAGRGASYFLTENKNVYVVGTNYDGQLCLGDRVDRTFPTLLDTLPNDFDFFEKQVQSITAGSSSLYLLMSDGQVLACGENTQGQLGLGDFTNATSVDVPTVIPTLENVIAIYSGPTSYSAYFVQENGTVYATGYNGGGQLGVGDAINRNRPTAVACSDMSPVESQDVMSSIRISGGNDHTLFLGPEATFACPDVEEDAPTVSPTITMGPTDSREPTTSPTMTASPTISSMPTTATDSPTVAEDNSTYMPSLGGDGTSGMPTASYLPTAGPSYEIPPSGDRAVENDGASTSSYEYASWLLAFVIVWIGL